MLSRTLRRIQTHTERERKSHNQNQIQILKFTLRYVVLLACAPRVRRRETTRKQPTTKWSTFRYVVPPAHAPRVRRLAADVCAAEARQCAHFLRHKTTLLSPAVFKASNIPLRRALQTKGTFVVVQAGL